MHYKATFFGGLKNDTPIALTLGVSMNNAHQTGEELAAFLGLALRSYLSGKISTLDAVISDYLQRFYEGGAPDASEEEKKSFEDRIFNRWLDTDENWKYLSIFKGTIVGVEGSIDIDSALAARKAKNPLTPDDLNKIAKSFGVSLADLKRAQNLPLTIRRWRALTNSAAYEEAKAQVDAAYSAHGEFYEIARGVAAPHASKAGLENAIEYAKEESATFAAAPLKYLDSTYSSKEFNGAITWAIKNIGKVEPRYHGYGVYEVKPRPFTRPKETEREESKDVDTDVAACLKAAWATCPDGVVPKVYLERADGSRVSVTYQQPTPPPLLPMPTNKTSLFFWRGGYHARPRSDSDPLPSKTTTVVLRPTRSAYGDIPYSADRDYDVHKHTMG